MQNTELEASKEIIEGYRLSPQQKHLWLLQHDDRASYRVQCSVSITGNINLEVLKLALEKVVNRHEILRTTFQHLHGLSIPLQVISNNQLVWITADLSSNTPEEQKVKFAKISQEFSQLPFDVEQRSILYASLVMLSNQQILLLSLPALCTDTVGMQNLVAEASRYYAAIQGEVDDEPLQYADIAEWQNELLAAEEQEVAQQYWCKQDFFKLLTVKLPWEKQVTALKFQPLVAKSIDLDLTAAIALDSQYNTSISTFLLTCWYILLSRVTGEGVVIGTAFTGRRYQELELAIGLLAKYLPLHFHLSDTVQFPELLQQIEIAKQDAERWQEYFTWEAIFDSNDSQTNFSFSFDFVELAEYCANDVSFSIDKIYSCIERFKVKLFCIQTANTLNLEFHYDANLFASEDIQNLAAQFQTLLKSIVANPNMAISQLEILSDRQRHQLLFEFNQTQADYPQKCLHQLFEEQVVRTPNNIAVVFVDTPSAAAPVEQLTYAELNARANQLAHYLRSLGIGAEVLVGICVERSLLMLVGLLGILKAGGAYVPLDPTYPQERLAFMLEDATVPVLLTQKHLKDSLPQHKAQVICLDADWQAIASNSPDNPDTNVTPANLAYVIYTSGSTGKPKGTLIEHRGLVNYLSWCVQAYAVDQGEGALVHSSIGFDATITGLFAPLLVGRQVQLLPEKAGIEALGNALQTSRYSLVKITPAHLELLSQQIPPQQAAGHTNALIIGGENLTAEQIGFWQEFAPETLLVNEYGPTETVVGCCVYRVPQGQHYSGSIPIGRAIANTQLYILDRHLQPVPLGVAGELYIGGDGVGRGYLNQPELTAQKFISNPFTPGTKLYKSGDLARYLPNGEIEYLGRSDDQVKIRGFRIELGEIETLLSQHPSIQKTIVVAREDAGNKRLVAYVVPTEQVIDINQLRDFLKAQLPEYMLPTAFVLLKTLPLTANGKVDRKALPAPEQIRPELAAFVAPRSATEQAIADIWAEVLKLPRVGIHDNFFELGGHSLLLTQVTSRLHTAFGIEVSLRQLFETPTIAQLAEVIAQKLTQQTDDASLAQMLTELEQLSEDEVQSLIAQSHN